MDKIQLESGPASSATHRITQPSTTLNRRYVTRPTNLAIEEAARAISPEDNSTPSTPSRLVNLRVHSADLLAATNEPVAAQTHPASPFIHNIVELGGPIAPEPEPEPTPSIEASSIEVSSAIIPLDDPIQPVAAPMDFATANYTDSTAYVEPVTPYFEPSSTYAEPANDAQMSPYTPALTSAPAPVDPRDLAVSIAADYAAANMSLAAANEPVTPVSVDDYVGIDTTSTDSVDAIARAASDAISSIRNATEPEEISEQIASLQSFADSIRVNSSMPEMTELSNTIEKFINVAKKSTKVKEATKKVSLSSKATRAADKVEKSSAKVISRTKSTVSSASTSQKVTPKITKASNSINIKTTRAKASPAPATTTKSTSKPSAARAAKPAKPTKPFARLATKPAARKAAPRPTATSPAQDQALRHALRSVAAMEDEPEPRLEKTPIRHKGGAKRFALAFVCAAVCVGAITYFVSTNIPDISVRVAALQTGVEASYPSYIPRDYSLKDISSESGKLTMTFEGPDQAKFTLSEEKSSWDSTTLLRNYVEPTWKDNYTSTHEQGITIYVSGSNATWVNGGVLYKISSSNASLTNKQLRNIVTSM